MLTTKNVDIKHMREGWRVGLDDAALHLGLQYTIPLARARGHLLYIRIMLVWRGEEPPPEGGKVRLLHFTSVEEAKQALHEIFRLNDQGYDVFHGVNLRTRCSGKKKDVGAVWMVHCEIDVPKDMPAEQAEALVRALGASFWVKSGPTGGLHIYFALDEGLDHDRAEALNQALAIHLGATDSVFDVSRHLRLAGTINHKAIYRGTESFRTKLSIPDEEDCE